MHLGIYITLDIVIKGVYIPMLIFLVNPFYLIWISFVSIKSKLVNVFVNHA